MILGLYKMQRQPSVSRCQNVLRVENNKYSSCRVVSGKHASVHVADMLSASLHGVHRRNVLLDTVVS